MFKIDVTMQLEDGTTVVGRVRMPEQHAFEQRFGQRLGAFFAEFRNTRAADDVDPAERAAVGLEASFRICWLGWKAATRSGATTLPEDEFLALIDTYSIAEVAAAAPFPPAPTSRPPSSSASAPGLPPPGGVSPT